MLLMSGFFALVIAIAASRFLQERGYAGLTPEEKLRLMDGFAKSRAYSFLPLAVLVLAYVWLSAQGSFDRAQLSFVYFGLLAVYVAWRSVQSYRKLASLQLPAAYRKRFTAAQLLSLLGGAWLCFTLLSTR